MLTDSEGRDGRWEVHRSFVTVCMRLGGNEVPDGGCVSQPTRGPSTAFGFRLTSLRMTVFWVFLLCAVCFSQDTRARAERAREVGSALRRGTNEFGIWGGYSPFSFVLKGTSKDRELLLVNLQYARTLIATRPFKLKYTADIVPLALEFQPTQRYVVDGALLTNPADVIYGTGANPIGLQANFGPKKIQPMVNGSLGFLYFDRQMPIIGSSQFNYNITVGFGAQFFPRAGRSFTVGWKYHHLSNNYQAHLNPGIDSGVFYVGFSIFRTKPGQ
jgi:hypothetical protein